jgi:hypothetical protein
MIYLRGIYAVLLETVPGGSLGIFLPRSIIDREDS